MSLLYAQELLKPETVAEILELGRKAEQIADRWAMGWPRRTRELEKQGTLLQHLREQTELENRALAEAHQGGNVQHLADHEIAELYELREGPP